MKYAEALRKAKKKLAQMSVEEKLGQLPSKLYGWECYKRSGNSYELTEKFKSEVQRNRGAGYIYGLFRADPWSGATFQTGIPFEDRIKVYNMVQKYVLSQSPNGIPAFIAEEGCHGAQALGSAVFPVNLAVGCSFNPALYAQCSEYVSRELRATGCQMMLSTCCDILSDPRWGRSEECYGEDPYLAREMSKHLAIGIQGNAERDLPGRCVALLKAVCAQGACEGGRNLYSASIGEREMREVHLQPVAGGIEGGALGFMAAYNDVDGVPNHANGHLINGIIRKEMGFKGFFIADGTAIDRLGFMTGSAEESAATALKAGIDMGLWDDAYRRLGETLERKLIGEADIDRAVLRILTVKYMSGIFDEPYLAEVRFERKTDLPLKMAEETPVLVKNDGILPLKGKPKVLVCGSLANSVYAQLGDYTSFVEEGRVSTYFEAIRSRFEGSEYVTGFRVKRTDEAEAAEALARAAEADVVICVVGGSSARYLGAAFADNGAMFRDAAADTDCGEGVDLSEVRLYANQTDFVKRLSTVNPNIVCIVNGGRPYGTEELLPYCRGAIYSFYNGERGAEAMAAILAGEVNPSGKFPVSVAACSAQLPVAYNHRITGRKGEYSDRGSSPQFEFGYGLSYTEFVYSNLSVPPQIAGKEAGGAMAVRVDVCNAGEYDGKESVLVFASASRGETVPRVKRLVGFKKVFLRKGEEKTVEITLGAEAFSAAGADGKIKVIPGAYTICVGKLAEQIVVS